MATGARDIGSFLVLGVVLPLVALLLALGPLRLLTLTTPGTRPVGGRRRTASVRVGVAAGAGLGRGLALIAALGASALVVAVVDGSDAGGASVAVELLVLVLPTIVGLLWAWRRPTASGGHG